MIILRLYRGGIADSPRLAESDPSSMMPFRLQSLSTQFRNDTVTFSYDTMAYAGKDIRPVAILPLRTHKFPGKTER